MRFHNFDLMLHDYGTNVSKFQKIIVKSKRRERNFNQNNQDIGMFLKIKYKVNL